MNGRKMMAVVVGLLAMVSMTVFAWDAVNMNVDGLNVKGSTLAIDGTKYTGTATQLNLLIAGTTSSSLEPAKILVGNATSNAAAVTVSGDVTIATNGAVSIGSSKITSAMIVDDVVAGVDMSASLYTGWVTNSSTLSTNIVKFYHGVVTNVTLNP